MDSSSDFGMVIFKSAVGDGIIHSVAKDGTSSTSLFIACCVILEIAVGNSSVASIPHKGSTGIGSVVCEIAVGYGSSISIPENSCTASVLKSAIDKIDVLHNHIFCTHMESTCQIVSIYGHSITVDGYSTFNVNSVLIGGIGVWIKDVILS